MTTLLGVVYYEYRMGIRRWGLWLAFILAAAFSPPYFEVFEFNPSGSGVPALTIRQMAGMLALMFNFWMPVIGGIAIADRLPRDWKLGVRELLESPPMSGATCVLGKYLGALVTILTPVFLALLGSSLLLMATKGAPLEFVIASLAAFVAVNVPAYAFIGAFSIACPALLPVRVYQVLFTGYWFWGNFLNPTVLPTLAGTLLTPVGVFAAVSFFGTSLTMGMGEGTALDAVLSILALAACAAAALVALERYLAWQRRGA